MSTFGDLKAVQIEYEQRLRDAEHNRQVRRMENANGGGLAKRAAKAVAVLATTLGLK